MQFNSDKCFGRAFGRCRSAVQWSWRFRERNSIVNLYKVNRWLSGYCKVHTYLELHTGKSFSEALILASVNPQYDIRLFIELQVQSKKNTSSEHVVYKNCFECQKKQETIFVHNMF